MCAHVSVKHTGPATAITTISHVFLTPQRGALSDNQQNIALLPPKRKLDCHDNELNK